MANIVEFIINITTKGNAIAARNVSQLQNRLEAADVSANKLARSVKNNLSTALSSLPGAQFFMNPIVALTAGIGVISKLGMSAQNTSTAFEVLVGSQKASAEMLERVNAFAMDTPYSRLGVQDATKTMLGFGVASKDVLSDLRRLGDIAGGDNQRLQQLALVFGQVASAGKLQGQDLLQLINAGYNPLQDIAALTGTTMERVRTEMGKGNISFNLVRAAFVRATSEGGRFAGMLDKLRQNESGVLGVLSDTFIARLLDLYEIIKPLLIPVFKVLTAILEALAPVLKILTSSMQWLIGVFRDGAPYITAAFAGLVSYLTYVSLGAIKLKVLGVAVLAVQKAQWLLNIAMTANPIGLIIAAIAALVVGLAVCWNKFDKFRAVVRATWDTVKGFASIIKDYVLGAISSMLAGIGKVGEALGLLFKGDFSGAWSAAKSAASLLLNIEGRKNAVSNTKNLIGGFGSIYDSRLQQERARKGTGISTPTAAAGVADGSMSFGAQGGASAQMGGRVGRIANDITAGGTRSTNITLTIGSLIGHSTINVTDSEMSLDELQNRVVEAMNRALQISTSSM